MARQVVSVVSDQRACGVESNARLTSLTGMVLLVMLAVEGYTIFNVGGMITLHIVLGALLVGPVLLKVATTMYRFVRYYMGAPAYVRKGPPHVVLRVLGPVVIVSSLAVLGTGIALAVSGSGHGPWGLAHRASFIVWLVVMTVHVLGHVRDGALSVWAELRGRRFGSFLRGRTMRLGVVALALVAGVGAAALVLPAASSWTHHAHRDHHPVAPAAH